ncbi:TPA: hypothetical protein ACM4B0_004841, partial [Escherichia coli]
TPSHIPATQNHLPFIPASLTKQTTCIACTQQFLSWQEYSPTDFLRFSPVVMPVKVVRCFHHQRRLRLTTSGGDFYDHPSFADG